MLPRSIRILLLTAGMMASCGKDSKHSDPVLVAEKSLAIESNQMTNLIEMGGNVSIDLTASGTVDERSLTWTLSGDYPESLKLTNSGRTAHLQGLVAKPRSYKFKVQAADNKKHTAEIELSVDVRTKPFGVSTQLLTNAQERLLYKAEITTTGGDDSSYSWTVNKVGRIPHWLKTEGKGGKLLLSGTPEYPGLYDLSIEVKDGSGQVSKKDYVLAVDSVLTLAATPIEGVVERPFELPIDISGGKGNGFNITQVSGSLPEGLSLERNPQSSRALISGTPKQSGKFAVSLQVTDGFNGLAKQTLEFEIHPKLRFVTTSLPSARLEEQYEASIAVEGSIEKEYIWTTDISNTAGLSFYPVPGKGILTVTGRPYSSGYIYFSVTVTDANKVAATQRFSLYIAQNPPEIKTKELTAELEMEQEQSIKIEGSSVYSWGLSWAVVRGTLPTGLYLQPDPSGTSVALVGKAFVPGTYTFTLRLTDSKDYTEQQLTLKVKEAAPQFSLLSRVLPRARLDVGYRTAIESKHGVLKTWKVSEGQLPEGLTLKKQGDQTLLLVGNPTKKGFYSFTVAAESESGASSTSRYHLAVDQINHWFSAGTGDQRYVVDNLDLSHRLSLEPKSGGMSSASPDHRWYVYSNGSSSSRNKSFILVDLDKPEAPTKTIISDLDVVDFAWSPDGTHLAFVHRNLFDTLAYVRMYDLVQGKAEPDVPMHRTSRLVFSLDGRSLAVCSGEKELKILDLSSSPHAAFTSTLRSNCAVSYFAPYDSYLIAGANLLRLKDHVVDAEGILQAPLYWVSQPKFSGRYFLQSVDQKLWQLGLNAKVIDAPVVISNASASSIALSPDETQLLSSVPLNDTTSQLTIANANSSNFMFLNLGKVSRYRESPWSTDSQYFLVEKDAAIYEIDSLTLNSTKVMDRSQAVVFPQYTHEPSEGRNIVYTTASGEKQKLVIQSLAKPDSALREWELDIAKTQNWLRLEQDPASAFMRLDPPDQFLNYGKSEALVEKLENLSFFGFLSY